MEIWADIPNYGNHYQASNLGRIRVKDRIVKKFSVLANKIVEQKYKARLLNPSKQSYLGHLSVHLGYDNKKISVSVHRLVLEAFVGERPDGMECCHNNGVANDNRLENLRWDTHENNNKDRKLHGKYLKGKNHPMFGKKISEEHKKKLYLINIGKKHSEQTKEKMRKAHAIRKGKIYVPKQENS